MKLNEIKQIRPFLTDVGAIHRWIVNHFSPLGGSAELMKDGTVNVHGNAIFKSRKCASLKVQFGKINGSFEIYNNLMQLSSLVGFPREITGSLTVSGLTDSVTSMEGITMSVGKNYSIEDSNITSLQGIQKHIKGDFCISGNSKITSLIGGPTLVDGAYHLLECKNLTHLEGVARHIGGKLNLYNSGITSLVGLETLIDHVEYVQVNENQIISGGIGLILIPGFSKVGDGGRHGGRYGWQIIINSYAGRPDDIFDCQMELIDAGYEAYAQL